METSERTVITVEALINAPVEKVWSLWTDPKHITKWNNASEDWHTPHAENDLREGGRFLSTMAAKDGSMSFDFYGEYTKVDLHKKIGYTLGDGRQVQVSFIEKDNATTVIETFEAETQNTVELQQQGWQAILNNFKTYAENYGKLEKLHFEININADADKVYTIMLDDKSYRDWTSIFNPDSYYKGSWEKGSKILFLGPEKDGTTGGLVSRIEENIPGEFVSIKHLGFVKNDEEITSGTEVEGWAGAMENYTFISQNGSTLLQVDMDTTQEYKPYFLGTWQKALDRLKVLCEE